MRSNLLFIGAWADGFFHFFPQIFMAIGLPFCSPNEIGHYFCDIFHLLKIACIDTYITGILVITFSDVIALVTSAVLSTSYGNILFTLKNHSAEGKQKTLYTFGSHITIVILFFVPIIFIYVRPPTTFPEDKIFALYHHCTYVQSFNLYPEIYIQS